jgi:hypothetical protein
MCVEHAPRLAISGDFANLANVFVPKRVRELQFVRRTRA